MKYKQILINSLKTPLEQPSLFFPSILIFLTNLLLTLIFLSVTGLLPLLKQNPALIFEQTPEMLLNYINLNLKNNILNITIAFVIFITINFIIGSSLLAMKFGLIKEKIENKKLTIKKAFILGKKFTLQIIQLKLFVFVCMAIIILFINLIFPKFLLISKSISTLAISYFMIKISYQLINFILLFRYPILLTKNKGAFFTIKETFNFFKTKTKFVLTTWLLISIITTLATFSLFILNTTLTTTLSYGLLTFYIIESITNIIISLWQDIFIFLVYFFKEK